MGQCGRKLVECLEYGSWIRRKIEERGHSASELAHRGHSLNSVPNRVSDDEGDPTICHRKYVVPIATHSQLCRRDVAGGDF